MNATLLHIASRPFTDTLVHVHFLFISPPPPLLLSFLFFSSLHFTFLLLYCLLLSFLPSLIHSLPSPLLSSPLLPLCFLFLILTIPCYFPAHHLTEWPLYLTNIIMSGWFLLIDRWILIYPRVFNLPPKSGSQIIV